MARSGAWLDWACSAAGAQAAERHSRHGARCVHGLGHAGTRGRGCSRASGGAHLCSGAAGAASCARRFGMAPTHHGWMVSAPREVAGRDMLCGFFDLAGESFRVWWQKYRDRTIELGAPPPSRRYVWFIFATSGSRDLAFHPLYPSFSSNAFTHIRIRSRWRWIIINS